MLSTLELTEKMRKLFARTGALIWNGLPKSLKSLSKSQFQSKIKKPSPVDIFRKQMTILMFPKYFVILSK